MDGAAIASAEAAKVYGMDILAPAIEDNAFNYTRFIAIARKGRVTAKCNKTSLVYTTKNEPGALLATLKLFSDRGVNLSKLESRPIPGRPWEYMFYADVEGSTETPALAEALKQLARHTTQLKVLGCYPAA